MNAQMTFPGTLLALAFATSMGSLLWWMMHVPPPIPAVVARVRRTVGAVRRILVPIEDSEYARRAIEVACRLGERQKAEVILVHVIEVPMTLPLNAPLPDSEARAWKVLEEAKQIVSFHGLPGHVRVERARQAGPGIVQAVEHEGASMIVVGLKSGTAPGDLMGRTSRWLLSRAPCEVLLDKVS